MVSRLRRSAAFVALLGLLAAAPAGASARIAVDVSPGPAARTTVFEVTTLGSCRAIGGLDLCFTARLEAYRGARRLVARSLRRPSVYSAYVTTVRWPCAVVGRVRWAVTVTDTDAGRTARRGGWLRVSRCRR